MRLRITDNRTGCEIVELPGWKLPTGASFLEKDHAQVSLFTATPSAPISGIRVSGGHINTFTEVKTDGLYEITDDLQVLGPLEEQGSQEDSL